MFFLVRVRSVYYTGVWGGGGGQGKVELPMTRRKPALRVMKRYRHIHQTIGNWRGGRRWGVFRHGMRRESDVFVVDAHLFV
jgi:hypothetical protein